LEWKSHRGKRSHHQYRRKSILSHRISKKGVFNRQTHTVCHWKGTASYYDVTVDGQTNKDAAWYYPDPSAKADKIKDYVAFWRGVEVKN